MHIPAVGIVAEYNPLHKGHLYHIEQARAKSGVDSVVVVMSGCFVQRGEPAILDKWQRTEMALATGANLILELPVVFASHNAGVFASAAIDILALSGVVSHISYGVESPDWQVDRILDILLEEPAGFKLFLQNFLKNGYSFVEARSLALDAFIPGTSDELRRSNNILALSYLKRLRQKKWRLTPIPIKRIGAGYHDTGDREDVAASASGVRKKISDGKTEQVFSMLPDHSAEILRRNLSSGRVYQNSNNYWRLLRAVLLRSSPEEISLHAEIGEGIEHRMRKEALSSKTFEEWSTRCTSKRYPRGRVQRHAAHLLIGLGHWDNRAFQRVGPAYIRVLGTDAKGRKLLREMREKSLLPVITRCGAATGAYAKQMMAYDLLAAELWEQLVPCGEFGREHTRKVIIYQ